MVEPRGGEGHQAKDTGSGMFSIGQFALLTGLTVKALRYYDETGLLVPHEVDPASGYRRYSARQARTAATVLVLRQTGMPLEVVRQAVDAPDRTWDVVRRHEEEVRAERARQDVALARARAVLASYEAPLSVQTRSAPEQHWAAVVQRLDLRDETQHLAVDLDGSFAELAAALTRIGNPPVGPFWTTVAVDGGAVATLRLCWPVARPVVGDLPLSSPVDRGTLPDRREVYVRVPADADQYPQDGADGSDRSTSAPHPALLALVEHLDASAAQLCELRQVAVLGEDGLPVAVEACVTT